MDTCLLDATAEALFASDAQTGAAMTLSELNDAVERAVLRFGGFSGCLSELAAAYGDYPETAALRMRWARRLVEELDS